MSDRTVRGTDVCLRAIDGNGVIATKDRNTQESESLTTPISSHHILSSVVALHVAAIALSESRLYEPSEATGYYIERRTGTDLSIFYTWPTTKSKIIIDTWNDEIHSFDLSLDLPCDRFSTFVCALATKDSNDLEANHPTRWSNNSSF